MKKTNVLCYYELSLYSIKGHSIPLFDDWYSVDPYQAKYYFLQVFTGLGLGCIKKGFSNVKFINITVNIKYLLLQGDFF